VLAAPVGIHSRRAPFRYPGAGFVDKLIYAVERIAGAAIGILALITVAEATLRYIVAPYNPSLGHLPDGFIIGQTMQGIAICWGIATAVYADRHVTVDVLYTFVGAAWKRVFDITAYTINLAFMATFGFMISYKVLDILRAGEISVELRIPIWAGYIVAAVGIMAAVLMAAARWWQVVVQRRETHHAGMDQLK
jgi:TRAP-type C4-dicarboxylate transport system permease small subunit